MAWETEDGELSGQLHFGDSARREVTWINAVAMSFHIEHATEAQQQSIQIVRMTDDEIMSMIGIDHRPDVRG